MQNIELFQKEILDLFLSKKSNIEDDINNEKYQHVTLDDIKNNPDNFFKKIKNALFHQDFEKPDFNKNLYIKIQDDYTYYEYQFIKYISYKNEINDNIISLFLRLITVRFYLLLQNIDKKADIDFYMKFAEKIIDFYNENSSNNQVNELMNNFNLLNRLYYLSIHKLRFIPNEPAYTKYYKFIENDLKYSKQNNINQYLSAIKNALNINFDHLFNNAHLESQYIDLKKIALLQNDLIKILPEYIKNNDRNNYLIFQLLSSFFKLNLLKLIKQILNEEQIQQETRKILLIQCIWLIKAFYGEINLNLFFYENDAGFNVSHPDALKLFSAELAKLLNEASFIVIRPLFLVFQFLSNFKEYFKLNQNIYKKIIFLSKKNNDRITYLLTTTLYLKSIGNPDIITKEIVKVKKSIEAKPIVSLIYMFNNEVNSFTMINETIRNSYKIDPFIIDILENGKKLKEIVLNKIDNYLKTADTGKSDEIRKTYIKNLKKELNNYFYFANDPGLLRGLSFTYSAFLELYAKNNNMNFREDYLKKIESIKMSILDINPLFISISLILSRLDKYNFLLNYPKPENFDIDKTILKNYKNHKSASYEKVVNDFLNEPDLNFNNELILKMLLNSVKPDITNHEILSPESRILKVIVYIIESIINTDSINDELFLNLYKNCFVPARNEWMYDPIAVFYFNSYMSRQDELLLYNKIFGNKIICKFSNLKTPYVINKINDYIKKLLEKINPDDLSNELEQLSQYNNESLISEDGKRKNVTDIHIKNYIKSGKTVYFENYLFTNENEIIYLFNILEKYLINIGKSRLFDTIKFVLLELIKNANKGNLKRSHFKHKELDIEQKHRIGLNDFLISLEEKKELYENLLKVLRLKIRIQFQAFENNLFISVINNYKLTKDESDAIDYRISNAFKFKSLKEAYSQVFESKEGNGYGLIISILLLKKAGLEKSMIKIDTKDNKTIFKIEFPIAKIKDKISHKISEEIAGSINNLPALPENIIKLRKEIIDPSSSIDTIVTLVQRDTGLAANVIRLANSAIFIRTNPVNTLKGAIQLLGLKGLNNLITVYTSYNLLKNKIDKKRIHDIIEHSEKCGYFAKKLISILKLKLNIDDLYLPALLHDIGKIVIEGINLNLYEKIQNISEKQNIPIDIIEDLMGGLHHDIVGYLLAKKWNFPEVDCTVIKYHHNPRDAEDFFDETFLIYLANQLTHLADRKIILETLDYNILEYFDISDPVKLIAITKDLNESYKQFSSNSINII